MPPRTNVVLTYLKHLAVVPTANVPPPVMTVGLAHGSLGLAVAEGGGTGVFVRVAVGIIGVTVGSGMGVLDLVGVDVILVALGVMGGVFVFVGTSLAVDAIVLVGTGA